MNDLLGILIPMLMRGEDISTIFRHIAGADGSASYDGLQRMISMRNSQFAKYNPPRPSKELLQRHASAFVDTMGFNPMTGAGQGLSSLVASMYSFAPDIVGAAIGLPDSGSFYQQIANGAAGINVASGRGIPSLLNPYSAKDSYDNAVSLARKVHDMAVVEGRGFDINFTHGLKMSEVGTVAQRLLSSDALYKEYAESQDGSIDFKSPTGNRITTESDKFSKNLRELGSKFNETVSMLTKITGSVKDAIDLMDKMGGGNFLGGSADDALNIARKARSMAANIRVTAAMAGIDPRESYANMMGLQQGLTSRYGLDPGMAAASGLDSQTMNSAYKGLMAYQTWAANNPNASELEKSTVMAGAMGRIMQYADTSGEHMASMVAANRHRFSDDDINAIETAYRMGRPNDVQKLVRDRMGDAAFNDYMNDPAAIMSFRLHAGTTKEGRELLDRFENAGVAGNRYQSEVEGGRRMLRNDLSSADMELWRITGKSVDRDKERRDASAAQLRRLAVSQYGLSEEQAAKWDTGQLENYLSGSGADPRQIERVKHSAEIDYQIEEINNAKMSDIEETEARNNLESLMDRLGVSDDRKNNFRTSDLEEFYGRLKKTYNLEDDKSILGGKMSKAHAEQMIKNLKGDKSYWSVANTKEEMQLAVDALSGQFAIKNTAELAGVIAGDSFRSDKKSDMDALDEFESQAETFRGTGLMSFGKNKATGKDNTIKDVRDEAFRTVVANKLFKGGIGDLEEEVKGEDGKKRPNEKYQDFVSKVSGRIQEILNKEPGMSIDAAKRKALEEMAQDKDVRDLVGEEGAAQLDRLSRSDRRDDIIGRDDIASAERTVISRESANIISNASKSMFDAIDSTDKDAGKTFYENAKKLAAAGAIDKDKLDKLGLDSEEGRKKLETAEGRREIMEAIAPDSYGKRLDGLRTALGSGEKRVAALAHIVTQAEKAGMSFDQLRTTLKDQGFSDESIEKTISYLDDDAAKRNQNALSDAINLESGSISRGEIERSKKTLGDLRDSLSSAGIEIKDIEGYSKLSYSDKEKKRKEWEEKLGAVESGGKKVFEDSGYVSKLLASASEKGDIGGVKISDILDKTKNVDIEKIDNTAVAGVTKEAHRKDSTEYDILQIVSGIADDLGKIVNSQTSLSVLIKN